MSKKSDISNLKVDSRLLAILGDYPSCKRALHELIDNAWDAATKKFKPRPGVKKLVLLLDGTWTQKDLNALVAAGWDEIYYPDEIDKLKASVLGTDKKGGVLPKLSREDDDEILEAAEETKKYGRKK